jgi:uncharacterized protein (DUF1684 family)
VQSVIGAWSGNTRLLLAATVVAAAVSCTSGPPPPVDDRPYEEQVQAFRAAKDAMLRSSPESPLTPEAKAKFTGLPYYPIDPAFHVPARLHEDRSGEPVVIELQTSTDELRRMKRVGTLGFTINGATYSLTAFADANTNVVTRLFVPFGDLTSGTETYRGGRYLDLDRTPTGLYDLDFNHAYHPYCVYTPSYVCPVPPRENRLQVAIRSGERLPS